MANRVPPSKHQKTRSKPLPPPTVKNKPAPYNIAPQLPAWFGSPFVPAGVIVAYVIVWGVFSVGFWRVGGYGVETDAFGSFLPEVRKMLRGEFTPLDGFKGPGYHAAVALVSFVARDLFLSAKIVALASSAIVLWLLFRLVRRSLGTGTAWVAMLFVATNAQFILFTIQVGTDMFFLAVALAAATLILERGGWQRSVVAGLLAGFAYLTRYNGVFLTLAGIVIMALADRTTLGRRQRLLRTGAFVGGVLVVFAPWSFYTWSRGLGFFFNANHLNIAYEMFGRDTVSWDQFWEYFNPAFASFGEVVRGNVGRFVAMLARNSIEHFWWDMRRVLVAGTAPWVVPLSIVWLAMIAYGLVRAVMMKRERAWPAIVLGVGAYGVLVPVFYGERFSLPMVPIYAVLAATAVTGGLRLSSKSVSLAAIPAICGVLLLWGGIATAKEEVAKLMETQPAEVGAVARAVGRSLPEGSAVLARKPHIAYFTGTEFIRVPFLDRIEELPGIALQHHAQYLFVSAIEAALRPPLTPLLDPRNAPPFLKPIAAVSGAAPAVLYEFTMKIPRKASVNTTESRQVPGEEAVPQKVRLGRAYLRAGRLDLANEWFQKALADDPSEPTALLGLIQLDEARARWLAQEAQTAGSNSETVSRVLDSVESRLIALAEAAPGSRDVQTAAGEFLMRRNKVPEAIRSFRRVAAMDPPDPDVIGVLGELEESVGNLDGAEHEFARLVGIDPGNATARSALGRILLARARPAEALKHLELAYEMDPYSPLTRALLARAYQMQGDSSRADDHWRGVLAMMPEGDSLHVEAQAALDAISTADRRRLR